MLRLTTYRGAITAEGVGRFFDFLDSLPEDFFAIVRSGLARQAELLDARIDDVSLPGVGAGPRAAYLGPSEPVIGELLRHGENLFGLVIRNEPIGSSSHREGKRRGGTIWVYVLSPETQPDSLAVLQRKMADDLDVELSPTRVRSSRFDELAGEGRTPASDPRSTDVDASKVLADKICRSLAVAIKSSSGLLLGDVPKQLNPAVREQADEVLNKLQQHGLISTEVVVVCRKTSAQVNRLPSSDLIQECYRK